MDKFSALDDPTSEKVNDKTKMTVYDLVTKITNNVWAKPALSGME
jgi:hypothetical protein